MWSAIQQSVSRHLKPGHLSCQTLPPPNSSASSFPKRRHPVKIDLNEYLENACKEKQLEKYLRKLVALFHACKKVQTGAGQTWESHISLCKLKTIKKTSLRRCQNSCKQELISSMQHIIFRVFPSAQPHFSQLVQASSTLEVECQVNLVPERLPAVFY